MGRIENENRQSIMKMRMRMDQRTGKYRSVSGSPVLKRDGATCRRLRTEDGGSSRAQREVA